MTKTLIKIIINKHSKYFACLAQSVEHSAVNRGVGGPSPSTGAKKNVKTFFFLCLFLARTPAAHLCGGTLCLDTSSELDALCCRKQVYTQRYFTGSVLSLQKPNGCNNVLFLCLFLVRTPASHLCGGTLCLDTSSELDALCCCKQVYTQRYFTGVRSFSTKAKWMYDFLFFVSVFGSYPCRTVVRRNFVAKHFK